MEIGATVAPLQLMERKQVGGWALKAEQFDSLWNPVVIKAPKEKEIKEASS